MDWNNDGKHDWTDDALFHEVINSDDSTNKKESSVSSPPHRTNTSDGLFSPSFIATSISLLYLAVLIPGDIPINAFTMFIGLICVIVLAINFLGWLYK